jgi:hypothetical protein
MSFSTRIKSAIAAYRFGSTDNPVMMGSSYFMPLSSRSTFNDKIDCVKAFETVPELNAVINVRARMKSRGKVRVVSRETGKDFPNQQYLVKVLRNPNWFQAYKEFKRQSSLFRDIHGDEIIYFNKAYGLPFTSVKSMYALPPDHVTTETPQDKPRIQR